MGKADYKGEHEVIKQIWRAAFAEACKGYGVGDIITLANPDNRDVAYFENQGLRVAGFTLERDGDITKKWYVKPEGLFLDTYGTANTFTPFVNYQLTNNPLLKVLYLNFSARRAGLFDNLQGFKEISRGSYGYAGPMESSLFYRSERYGAKKTIRRGNFIERFTDKFSDSIVSVNDIREAFGDAGVQALYKASKNNFIKQITPGVPHHPATWQLIRPVGR